MARNEDDQGIMDSYANAYLGGSLEAGHGLSQDLLLTRGERAVATTSGSSLGGGRSGAVLGVVRFVCHFEKVEKGDRSI